MPSNANSFRHKIVFIQSLFVEHLLSTLGPLVGKAASKHNYTNSWLITAALSLTECVLKERMDFLYNDSPVVAYFPAHNPSQDLRARDLILSQMVPCSGYGSPAGELISKAPYKGYGASQVAPWVKNPPALLETWIRSLGWDDPLQEGMATHSSILAWRISWREEAGRLQSMGLTRFRHSWSDWACTRDILGESKVVINLPACTMRQGEGE